MFDVGLSELMVIAVVALIVLGPERLPRVARTAGHLLGRLQRYVNDVKADINREIQLDELRKVEQQFHQSVREVESSVSREIHTVETDFNQSIAGPVEPAPADVPATTMTATLDHPELTEPPEPSPQLELGLGVAPPDTGGR